jgi:predicted small secreted protein
VPGDHVSVTVSRTWRAIVLALAVAASTSSCSTVAGGGKAINACPYLSAAEIEHVLPIHDVAVRYSDQSDSTSGLCDYIPRGAVTFVVVLNLGNEDSPAHAQSLVRAVLVTSPGTASTTVRIGGTDTGALAIVRKAGFTEVIAASKGTRYAEVDFLNPKGVTPAKTRRALIALITPVTGRWLN